jgi:ADP-ribosylglycohydrolase
MNNHIYRQKLAGAIIGRFAGCALGAPVEMMEIGALEAFCKQTNQPFPPTNYFMEAPDPDSVRYKYGKGRDFTQPDMIYLSTDDDIAYTILSLLMMEEKYDQLTTEDVARFWLQYLPEECTFTAERTTLQNLKQGIPAQEAALIDNDQFDFIGAAIRIDGYAYVYPGQPDKAVSLAYHDAIVSHREDGLYSALYFTALVSMAFTSTNIEQSMIDALDYIPEDSNLYQQLCWAIEIKDTVTNYKIANQLVTNRFPKMEWAHAVNNACLTIWGIYLGQEDYDKGITETVAMGYDNDCTAATVGSVLGAYRGIDSIDPKWYSPWNNTILSYLNGIESFQLDDIIERFYTLYQNLNNTAR